MLITHVFEKKAKKRLSLKTQFKIEYLLPFTSTRKVLPKMPGLCLGHLLIIINELESFFSQSLPFDPPTIRHRRV